MLAPTLFNLFLEAVIAKALESHARDKVRIHYHPEAELVGSRKRMTCESLVWDLEYADDICLVASARELLEEMLHSVDQGCNSTVWTRGAHKWVW